jgi:hypothetical protein
MLHLFSCSETKEDRYVRLLTNNSEKYWIIIEEYPFKRYQGVCFKKDGTYTSFYIEKGRRYFDRHQFGNSVWRISNDSLIRGRAISIIEYINDEIIVLNSTSRQSIYSYIKSPDQTSKLETPPPSRIDTFYM